MFLENKLAGKILFYFLFSIFIVWIILDPKIPLNLKDGCLIVLFVALVHSYIDNQYLLNKVNKKYEAQSKMLSSIFRSCGGAINQKGLTTTGDIPPEISEDSIDITDTVSYKVAKKYLNGDIRLYDASICGSKKKGTFFSVVKDTTEVDILKEKIAIQNAQLSSILNNMPFVVYLKDLEGRFIAGNKKLETLIKRKNDELVGLRTEDIYRGNLALDIKGDDARVMSKLETVSTEVLSHLFAKEGTWFRVIKSPIIGPNKKVLGIIVIVKNINKEKEIELHRDNFVATLTHDLKTPTNAQLTGMDVLLSGAIGSLNDEQRELVQQVKNSNIYMSNMIATILDTYKAESTNQELVLQEFDFFEVVNQTCKELACLADTREQKVVLKSFMKNTFVTGDKLQLKRAVTNLISNAIIHGFEKSEVIVEINEKRNNFIFEVKNHSRYIDDDRMKEIFEKYKSAKYAKSNKASTGLGLYLSREIIRRHCGEIYANSWRNDTCVFGFNIPKNFKLKTKQPK